MITSDYRNASIESDELEDLKSIAGVPISSISLEDYPNLLVFPDSFEEYDRGVGRKMVCEVSEDNQLQTNSIVGFVGRNKTQLSIHSRFAENNQDDYFLHYMLQKVAKINFLNLQHTLSDDSVFDFLLYLFPSYLKKASAEGICKQYKTHKCNDANVRGAIDVSRHIQSNVPFNGKIAYTTREYCCDNSITQLVRHTIEYIVKQENGAAILSIDEQTKEAVSLIKSVTPSYQPKELRSVINKNTLPINHPYFINYAPLQRLCIQILRHEEMKYGHEDDEVYGVLIDAAWLWEEYLDVVLQGRYVHYKKDEGKRFYLFENFQQIIPDYLSLDKRVVADAKYIPLNKEKYYGEEKATSIYYKTITYMYRFCSKKAYLFYPHPDEEAKAVICKIKSEQEGTNGGVIIKQGLRIPSGSTSFMDFSIKMRLSEERFLAEI